MNSEFLLALMYLNLWLVKALRLSATPALSCSERRCTDSRIDLGRFFYNLLLISLHSFEQ